jgi:hypothetical protein
LACDNNFHANRRVILHAENLRHGTDGFTSSPKECTLLIFSPEKSDGFGPRSWVPEASMLTTRPPKPLKKNPPQLPWSLKWNICSYSSERSQLASLISHGVSASCVQKFGHSRTRQGVLFEKHTKRSVLPVVASL